MGYYIRVIGLENIDISLNKISARLIKNRLKADLKIDKGSTLSWTQFTANHIDNNKPICCVKRNPVEAELLGEEEIQELLDDIDQYKPLTSVKWLKNFLPKVKVIYAIQIFNGAYQGNGWDIIDAIKNELWSNMTAIIQADNEGYSNLEGYHILWQFSESVSGEWYMALLNEKEQWVKFKIDLANKDHKKSFCKGEIPEGVSLII